MDYLSCALTILSTVLIGRKLRIGWIIAGINSIVICYIATKVHQYGLIPANLFCIGLYVGNIRRWSKA